MDPVSIATIKEQAFESERFINDLEDMELTFAECEIIQIDSMTNRQSSKDRNLPLLSRVIQPGSVDLIIYVDRVGDMLSWSLSLMDDEKFMLKRLERIGMAA
ncbi:MAG: hypothetical protein M1300_06420 [Epsilonproteobacteria bacterium]|nr:hypothetical protein [Campylobacterota bacterium]